MKIPDNVRTTAMPNKTPGNRGRWIRFNSVPAATRVSHLPDSFFFCCVRRHSCIYIILHLFVNVFLNFFQHMGTCMWV